MAQRRLATPGGSETFVLTLAEHIARLGHEVVVHALELGLAATVAEQRAISVVRNQEQLPEQTDATIALDRVMAVDLARRYPSATRLYVMHNPDEIWLPPPEPGIVAATLAPNDRLALLARGCAGAGEVVRIRQPVDLRRFSPRGWARDHPKRILLLSNYLEYSGQRVDQLKQAWSRPGLEWQRLGYPEPTTAVAEEMAKADIVVGYGRSILEAMACGRPAYVHDHAGSDGWVTAERYDRLEADGFAGTGVRPTPSLDLLREDFARYGPALGQVGQDLARTYHDARMVAASVVAVVERLGPSSHRHDPAALSALHNLAAAQLRTDLLAEDYRVEAKRQAEAARRLEVAIAEATAEAKQRETEAARRLEVVTAEAKQRETEAARRLEVAIAEATAEAKQRETEAARRLEVVTAEAKQRETKAARRLEVAIEEAKRQAEVAYGETERDRLSEEVRRLASALEKVTGSRRFKLITAILWPIDRVRSLFAE